MGLRNRLWPIAAAATAATLAAVPLLASHAVRSAQAAEDPYPLRVELPPPPGMELAAPTALDSATDGADDRAPPSAEERPRGFAEAFADLPAASPPKGSRASLETAPPSPSSAIIAVRFNLAEPFAGGDIGAIEVRKGVRVNGSDAGDATIRVTEGATLAIARDELNRLLAAAGRADAAGALAGGGSFVSFDRIRKAGVGVRYDAVADRILLSS